MKYFFLLAFSIVAIAGACTEKPSSGTLSGRMVKVADGDTFTLLTEGKNQFRIRLNGIDAPEKGQDFYRVAKDRLSQLLAGRTVRIKSSGKDKYGRLIADVYLEDNRWVNLELVNNGLAWHFKKYSSNSQLHAAEQAARAARVGIWSQPNPIAPWSFRSRKKFN